MSIQSPILVKRQRVVHGRRRIALGIAISGATLAPGKTRTQQEIANYAECTRQQISQIEKQALRKLRLTLDPNILSQLKS